jgi:predicted nucleic acid-binding protein
MASEAETVVLDASVAVKWHLRDEEHAAEAALLLTAFTSGAVTLIAPRQIRYEVPSAIAVATRGMTPRLTPLQGHEAITDFLTTLSLGIETVDTDDLIQDAFPLLGQHNIAYYDALYLALANQRQAALITADNKLYQRIKGLPNVTWVGDYQPRYAPS